MVLGSRDPKGLMGSGGCGLLASCWRLESDGSGMSKKTFALGTWESHKVTVKALLYV